jgi:hypothetical protein
MIFSVVVTQSDWNLFWSYWRSFYSFSVVYWNGFYCSSLVSSNHIPSPPYLLSTDSKTHSLADIRHPPDGTCQQEYGLWFLEWRAYRNPTPNKHSLASAQMPKS